MGMCSYPKLKGITGYAYERVHGVAWRFKRNLLLPAHWIGYLTYSTAASHPCRWIRIRECFLTPEKQLGSLRDLDLNRRSN